uniref:Uncharacterized protein n=1 Tax=Sphaerodactylus townsendi TaxID=933632 RepID=A0ACB8FAN1_9SAUR
MNLILTIFEVTLLLILDQLKSYIPCKQTRIDQFYSNNDLLDSYLESMPLSNRSEVLGDDNELGVVSPDIMRHVSRTVDDTQFHQALHSPSKYTDKQNNETESATREKSLSTTDFAMSTNALLELLSKKALLVSKTFDFLCCFPKLFDFLYGS